MAIKDWLNRLLRTAAVKRDERCAQKYPGNISRGAVVLLLWLVAGTQFLAGAHPKNTHYMTTVKATAPDDEAAIRALEDRFAAAVNAGDIDAIMKNYVPDESLVVFDIVPRRQYRGADAYRKDWEDFFSHFRGKPKFTITDLGITADGNLGFSHSFQHVRGTDMQGHPVDRTVRVTDGYRKIGGKWLIALEHISVPVDLRTGKADFGSKP